MKNIFLKIKNIALPVTLFLIIASCTNFETELVNNPSQLTANQSKPEFLLNSIQIQFGNFSSAVNTRVGRIMRHRNLFNTYSSDFNSTSPAYLDGLWDNAYRGVLKNSQLLENSEDAKSGKIPYYLGVSRVIKAYTLMSLVDLFGDVPYSEALDLNNNNPKVDKGADIYKVVKDLLSSAEIEFNKTQNLSLYPFDAAQDMYYSGTTTKWKKLINSLRIKMYVQSKASWSDLGWNGQTEINNIVTNSANYISTNSDDFDFKYSLVAAPTESRHPLFVANYVSAPTQFESNYLLWLMNTEKGLVDPRTRYYYYRQSNTTPAGTELPCSTDAVFSTLPAWRCYVGNFYRGRAHGDAAGVPADGAKRTVPGLYPAGGQFDGNQFLKVTKDSGARGKGILPLIDASFVQFLLAEYYYGIGDNVNALSFLNSAVSNSISKVMGFRTDISTGTYVPTTTAINDYKNYVTTKYNGAIGNDKLDVIVKEYFIASYGNGFEAYNTYRRTGMPKNMEEPLKTDVFPRTLLYPSSFINSNSNAPVKNATVKTFWDKNPDNFIK